MAVHGDYKAVSIAAGADLSSLQYKVVNVNGTLAVTKLSALGVLQNDPQSGEHATVAYSGKMKAYAGGTIAKQAPVILSASGTLVVGSLGIIGKALAAASSGGLVEFVGDFSTAP